MQNAAQALVVVRDQFALKNLSDDALRLILPAYQEAFRRLQYLLANLPPETESIARELWLRTQLTTIQAQFAPVADRIYQILPEAQARAFEEGLGNAQKYLEAGGIKPEVQQTTLSGVTAGGQSVSVTGNLPGFNVTSAVEKGFISPSITRQQVVAAARETGFSVLSPGGSKVGLADLLPNWMEAQSKQVERHLRAGFLLGSTNDEIAREIGPLGPGRKGWAMTEAVVRTSMAEASQSAHDAFYAANEDLLIPTKSGYKWWWDASNDTRLCQVCAPLDGVKFKERSSPPHAWPAHFSCRCKILPWTATQELLEEEEVPSKGSFLEATPVQYDKRGKRLPPPAGYTGDNAYKRPMKVDGQMQWVRRRDLGKGQTTAGDMLKAANEHSKKLVLGKHTEAFNKLTGPGGKYEKDPQGAVRKLLGDPLPPGSTAPRPVRGPKPKPPAPKPKVAPKPKAETASPQLKSLGRMTNAELVKELEEKYDLPVPPGLREERGMLLQELADRRGVQATPAKAVEKAEKLIKKHQDLLPEGPRKVADQGVYSRLQKEFDASTEELGKGYSGEVVVAKDGSVIKWGQIGEFEASAMRKLEGTSIAPKLLDYEDLETGYKAGAGAAADRTLHVIGRHDGLLKMSRVKGTPFEQWKEGLPLDKVNEGREAFLQASKKMHLKGVAHNDRHDGNFLLSETEGKVTGSFVDFGAAQVNPRAALIEALGNSNYKRDFQVESMGTQAMPKVSAAWERYSSNLDKVEAILASSPKGSQFMRLTVRTSEETLDKFLSEDEAWDLLKMLYEGV